MYYEKGRRASELDLGILLSTVWVLTSSPWCGMLRLVQKEILALSLLHSSVDISEHFSLRQCRELSASCFLPLPPSHRWISKYTSISSIVWKLLQQELHVSEMKSLLKQMQHGCQRWMILKTVSTVELELLYRCDQCFSCSFFALGRPDVYIRRCSDHCLQPSLLGGVVGGYVSE